ncbi:MAG TPA: hypothetical protein VGO93_26770, partial [Candidatus Xenobia bacterium]
DADMRVKAVSSGFVEHFGDRGPFGPLTTWLPGEWPQTELRSLLECRAPALDALSARIGSTSYLLNASQTRTDDDKSGLLLELELAGA